MQIRISRSTVAFLVAAGLTALATGCASCRAGKEKKEEPAGRMTLQDMSAPARASIEAITAGGKIDSIEKEVEKGRTLYDVEATVNDRHMEYAVATDGEIVGVETSIEFGKLPEAVQTAAEKYFGSTTGLTPTKGVEDGKISYEVEGTKDGKKVAATFDPNGTLLSEEKN